MRGMRNGNGGTPCPKCGEPRILPEARFCDTCGTRIPASYFQDRSPRLPVAAKPSKRATIEQTEQPSRSGKQQTAVLLETPQLKTEHRVIEPALAAVTAPVLPKARIEKRLPSQLFEQPKFSRTHILGAFCVTLGIVMLIASVLFGAAALSGIGLAPFIIGLLLLYLPSKPLEAPRLLQGVVMSSVANVERALRDLAPDTKAIYLKIQDRADTPMVLLSLHDTPVSEADKLDRFLLVSQNDGGESGLLLEAPGASLLKLMERESGIDYFDTDRESLVESLKSGMVETLEVLGNVQGDFTDEGLRLLMKDGALGKFANSLASSAPIMTSRLGCPICSLAICAAAKSLKTNMILDGTSHQGGLHTLTLRF